MRATQAARTTTNRSGARPARVGGPNTAARTPTATTRPAQPAASTPRAREPVAAQTADSTMRPPSSGVPGSALNAARRRLAHTVTSSSRAGTDGPGTARAARWARPASTRFAAGPAIAVRTVSSGRADGLRNWVCPPHRVSAISSVRWPKARPVRAWAASWTRTERARSTAYPRATP
ncbi:Uncharacterised protein [Streptococcus pneumoniae]|nr:Uncharacterised protein [Streptococcus pneumoniae]